MLDDDIHQAAVRRAKLMKTSLGKAVSDLARRGLKVGVPVRETGGLLLFDPPPGSAPITPDDVGRALEETP
jgi:hypothetical protein